MLSAAAGLGRSVVGGGWAGLWKGLLGCRAHLRQWLDDLPGSWRARPGAGWGGSLGGTQDGARDGALGGALSCALAGALDATLNCTLAVLWKGGIAGRSKLNAAGPLL